MRKIICVSMIMISVLLMSVVSAFAVHDGGGRGGGHGWAPLIGFGLGLGIWELAHPYYRYPYNFYNEPTVVIQQQAPDIYLQPAPQYLMSPAQEQHYWYYCQDPQGYYPYISQCPNGWMKVLPTPPTPSQPAVK